MPDTTVSELLGGYRWTQLLYVAAKLGIADHLAGGPLTPAQLALRCEAHPGSLYRVLRALAGVGIFAEDDQGRFGLTPAAERLRADAPDSLRPFALSYGEPWWWGAFGALLPAVQTGRTAFDAVHGEPFFTYLERHPEAAAIFHANMTAMTDLEAEAVTRACDVSKTQVHVDVGGGQGALAAAVLRAAPGARAILFDRPSVIEGATARLAALGIAERCTLVGGDFFTSVPEGGDLYTLKDILHDWDDDRCRILLGNLRRAMPDTARLILVERVIPPGNGPAPGKLVDVNMLVLTGGRERTEEEYRALLAASGFRLARVMPTGAETDVLEAMVD